MFRATIFNIDLRHFLAGFLLMIWAFAWAVSSAWAQGTAAAPTRGAVLFATGGCANCHTDTKNKGPDLAGGGPIKTPFGTFYAPNISSHPEFGIGKWTDKDFIRALRDGIAPDGSHYYPAFPYTSFTNMTDDDMRAIHAHIMSLPPVAVKSRPHDLGFPFNIRFGMIFWKLLFLEKGPLISDSTRSAEWNRGRYLANAVAHCAECHTPRNFMGGLDHSRWMAGNAKGEGPEGEAVPNITQHPTSGIGKWKLEEIAQSLEDGTLPDGDSFGSLMADVVESGTAMLSDADRRAIAVYIKSLKPLAGRGRK
ncbi:MAG: mono/diheme cytochrome c family protein [Alphaproteobacteria bacterium]|jgi:mono/diheme cytochrome c family protein